MKSSLLKGLHVKIRNHDKFNDVRFTDGVRIPLNKPQYVHRLFSKLSFTYNGKRYEIYSFTHNNGHTNFITVPNGKRYEQFPSAQLGNLRAFKSYMDMGFHQLKDDINVKVSNSL